MNFGNFIPHGFCLAWDPGLVALQAGSDVLIALAYYSIPAALVVFLRRRQDLAFRPIFGLFAAFILACGTTHVLGVVTLFAPVYWADGVLKAITAALSVATAIMLWPLLPKALALPSPAELSDLNRRLAEQIKERDDTAASLRESKQFLRELYARSPAILHATDADGRLTEVSQRWLDLFGYERAQVIGRSMRDFYQPGTIAELPEHLASLMANPGHAAQERRIVLSSGEVRDAEAVYTLEYGSAGELRRILVALTDVTLRKQAEAALRESEDRLRQAQKMEAVGQLTGGIAHDFNNLLTTIMASLEMLEQRQPLDGRGQRMVGNALEGARRAARLTSQLLSFSRRSRLTPESLDPQATIDGIGDLLAQTSGNRIKLTIGEMRQAGDQQAGTAEPWPIMADRNQLEAAILNLVINARDAITGSGDIGVVFTNRTLTEAEALCYGPEAIAPGDYVGIAVTDTGAGMPDNVARQALEPFFTTKAAGAGTGLGLSQTYGFATQSGGTIRITSVQGQGTTVEILLPRAASPVPQQALPQPAAGYQSQGGVIVLAEDDALLRHTVSEVLRSQGYIVETACDGVSALALLNTLPAVDLLLTDVMMPGGMNGVELALSAREVAPELTIMFATGFSDQRLLEQWPEALDVINKPFAVDLLISRIESAMTKPKTAAARADYAARVPPDPVG